MSPDQTYAAALKAIDALMDAGPDTVEGKRLAELARWVEEYERLTVPIAMPTPAAAIRFRMEQMGYTQTNLADLVGSRGKASEYLSGKRRPGRRHAIIIYEKWGIPLDVLLQTNAPPESGPFAGGQ